MPPTYGVEVQLVLALLRRLLHRQLHLWGERGVKGVDLAGGVVHEDLLKGCVTIAAQAVHQAARSLQEVGPQPADPLAAVADAPHPLLKQRAVVVRRVVVPDPGVGAQVCCVACECRVWQLLALLICNSTCLPIDCLHIVAWLWDSIV